MKTKNKILLLTLAALPLAGLVLAAENSPKPAVPAATAGASATQIARGKYLVGFGDCNACHTPLKMGQNGPEPDMTRMLSGHPQNAQLPPPPKLENTPWFAATAGMTAWTGPWGITYSANLTPDIGTGRHMGHGRPILPPMPWPASASLSDDDLKAVFAYLRSIPAITNAVPQPLGPDGKALFPE